MHARSCLLAVIAAALGAADLPTVDHDGQFTIHTLWVEAGLAPGLLAGHLPPNADPRLAGAFERQIDPSWQSGTHVGVEWSSTHCDLDGHGWNLGVAIWDDVLPGRITGIRASQAISPVDVTVEALSLAIAPAIVRRFDTDDLAHVFPREWQLEFALVGAVGAGRARIASSAVGDWGLVWQGGLRCRLHAELAHGVRLGVYAGGLVTGARCDWQGSGPAEFIGAGPIAGAMLGYDF
jgi:hypothetical protein